MPHYRIYKLDDLGKIRSASDAECVNDSEALAEAEATVGETAYFEIWQGGRRVIQRSAQKQAVPVRVVDEAAVTQRGVAVVRGGELERSIIVALASARAAGDTDVVDGLMRAWRALLLGRRSAVGGYRVAEVPSQFRVVTLSQGLWTIEWPVNGVLVGPECGDFRTEEEAAHVAHDLTVIDVENLAPSA